MNYSRHYDDLIDRARHRNILPGVYFETHHIVPKCLGGTDHEDNLVKLLPEEHFVAHQLLVKIHPQNPNLIYAAFMMTISRKGQIRNNKLYKWIRNRCSEVRKGVPKTEEHRLKMSVAKLNVPKSNEHRIKLASILDKVDQCPHCLKSGRLGPMTRWHFDNCKFITHNY